MTALTTSIYLIFLFTLFRCITGLLIDVYWLHILSRVQGPQIDV